jgi:hypothetical protein
MGKEGERASEQKFKRSKEERQAAFKNKNGEQ